MGNRHVISAGEIQVMSAGSGVTHSEYNDSNLQDVNFLQIWIQPKVKGIQPRYGQRTFAEAQPLNRFQMLVSPDDLTETIWINQNAYLSMAHIESGKTLEYCRQALGNGLYFFIIDGQVSINALELFKRDAVGLTGVDQVQIYAQNTTQILCIDIPMSN